MHNGIVFGVLCVSRPPSLYMLDTESSDEDDLIRWLYEKPLAHILMPNCMMSASLLHQRWGSQ